MSERAAMFFICDEVLVALNGKYTISGLYTGDIVIPHAPTQLGQLIIMFEITTPMDKPFQKLVLQVSFPGEQNPRQLDLSSGVPTIPIIPDRSVTTLRLPFLIQTPVLNSGPIEAKVIHEDGELLAGKHWIITTVEAQANIAAAVATKP
jgi:hypothetical protein